MADRSQKLLILAGDQGAYFESRDIGRLKQIIIDEIISNESSQTEHKKILDTLCKVIMKIPQKWHIYAAFTAKLSEKSNSYYNHVIQESLSNLEISLNSHNLYESINVLAFLSELMNISLFNSLAFMNIMEDIIDGAQSESNPKTKKFFITVLVRVLPFCLSSLHEKLLSDLKSFMQKLSGLVEQDPLFICLNKSIKKGKIINFSKMSSLSLQFETSNQYNSKRKIKIESSQQCRWKPVEYFNLNRGSEDELYKEFIEEQGKVHHVIMEQLIEQLYSKNIILEIKIKNYMSSVPVHKTVFLYKMVINLLIAKSLKSTRPIVEQSILINFVNKYIEQEKQESKLTKTDLVQMVSSALFQLFNKAQSFEFSQIVKIADLISFVFNGWKQNEWDWERYIENQDKFAKRQVLLIIILEKIRTLNEKFIIPKVISQFSDFQPQEVLTNQQQYKAIQQMQAYQKFQNALALKSDASIVKPLISNEKDYEYFLQALFRRTSISQTHLKKLVERYEPVLNEFREYDWTLINKIRNFWKKSFLHRQMYLQLIIKREFTTFNSYVNYIGKLENRSEKDMLWIKVELGELNNIFGGVQKK